MFVLTHVDCASARSASHGATELPTWTRSDEPLRDPRGPGPGPEPRARGAGARGPPAWAPARPGPKSQIQKLVLPGPIRSHAEP